AQTDATRIGQTLYRIDANTAGPQSYFPEKHLAAWLAEQGISSSVYALDKSGLEPTRAAYRALEQQIQPDALVVVDGGTDILMHGDEAGLGTPAEDITSLLAASEFTVATKLVTCVGFGIDSYHGVAHADFLENVAGLVKAGAFLGTHALLPTASGVEGYLAALDYVHERTPGRESIVNSSLAAAVRGEFGDHHTLERTRRSGTELFINPLMSLVWTFDLEPLAARCRYAEALDGTQTMFEVHARIEAFRARADIRPRRPLPM
ncbi:MAG: DUF1152 domain-containing protein, partial [Deltaproteobacteria bacterium]|nr:DUF1152 domain-containing protein [Deltaproteobacteria bacterium]